MTTSLTFVGTATTVLRLGPFTLLTDPNFIRRGQRLRQLVVVVAAPISSGEARVAAQVATVG